MYFLRKLIYFLGKSFMESVTHKNWTKYSSVKCVLALKLQKCAANIDAIHM